MLISLSHKVEPRGLLWITTYCTLGDGDGGREVRVEVEADQALFVVCLEQ